MKLRLTMLLLALTLAVAMIAAEPVDPGLQIIYFIFKVKK